MKTLVLGASGMLGFAVHRALFDAGADVIGTLRGATKPTSSWCEALEYVFNVNVESLADVLRAIAATRADVVVNATGAKLDQDGEAERKRLFSVNSMFPRLLAREAKSLGIYFIHFSTDGVFSGSQGMYDESARPDATDLYGMSKFLGEPSDEGSLVLRTSIVGRGLTGNTSLVDWFLQRTGTVKGYRRVVFSGLPANEIASVLATRIIPRPERLTGLYHLSAMPITKYALLTLLRDTWSLNHLRVEPEDSPVLDRSLDSSRLRTALSYAPAPWTDLVPRMFAYYLALDQLAKAP